MTEDERSAVLDACALVEAYEREDLAGQAVLLTASDDPFYLRRVMGTLAYLLASVDDPDVAAALAGIRRRFAGQATTP
jgi:hypothetical protein